jgi:hypothetical protein
MTNIADNINNIDFRDVSKEEAYKMEYEEHYKDILEVVKDEELAKKIVAVIPKGHYRENEDYYIYLKRMEKEMQS